MEKWLLLTTVLAFLIAAVLGVVPVFKGKLEDTVFAVLIAINAGKAVKTLKYRANRTKS